MDIKICTSDVDFETANVIRWVSEYADLPTMRTFVQVFDKRSKTRDTAPTEKFSELVTTLLQKADTANTSSFMGIDPYTRHERVTEALWNHIVPVMSEHCARSFGHCMELCMEMCLQECMTSFAENMHREVILGGQRCAALAA